MQLGPVAAEHEIAHIDAVGAGSCTVDNLPINLRVPPLRWLRFCRNRKSQWERHQQSLCMLVTLSFGCYLGAVKFRRLWRDVQFQIEAAVPRAVSWTRCVCPLVPEPGRRNDCAVECFRC